MEIIKYVTENWKDILINSELIIAGIIGIAILIPGNQPEKFLGGLLKVIKRISL